MNKREIKFRFQRQYINGGNFWEYAEIPQDLFNENWADLGADFNTLGQYTGLKDKNGKEIYEGDIVNYGDNYPSEVRYTTEGEGGIETCGFYLYEAGRGAKWEKYYPRKHTLFFQTNPIEVLGNVYENPELLSV